MRGGEAEPKNGFEEDARADWRWRLLPTLHADRGHAGPFSGPRSPVFSAVCSDLIFRAMRAECGPTELSFDVEITAGGLLRARPSRDATESATKDTSVHD